MVCLRPFKLPQVHPARRYSFLPYFLGASRNVAPGWVLAHPYASQYYPHHSQFALGPSGGGDCWFHSLAGVIALTLYSVGYLAKFFSETFESTDLSSQKNALKSPCGPVHCRPSSTDSGPMPGLLSGAIAYGCSNTMCDQPVLSDMLAGGIGLHLKLHAESADSWNNSPSFFFVFWSL